MVTRPAQILRAIRLLACPLLLLCLVVPSLGTFAASKTLTWTTSTILEIDDYYSWVYFTQAMCVDKHGVAHIVFWTYADGNNSLMYATNPGGEWNFSTIVSGRSIDSVDVATDSNGSVHVCFYDDGPESINYARIIDGVWNITIVGEREWGGGGSWASDNPKMALDSNGKVYIAAHEWDKNSSLRLITNLNGTWVSTGIPAVRNVTWPSIAVGRDGHVHVCYRDYNNDTYLVHATNESGSWTMDSRNVTWGMGWRMDSAIDSQDVYHIVTTGSNSTPFPHNRYRETSVRQVAIKGDVWSQELIDYGPSVGWEDSMVIDSNDGIHVSYEDGENSDLMYATNSGGSWTTTRVDEIDYVGSRSSIGVGPDNLPRICYYNETGKTLKFAWASEVEVPSEQKGLSGPMTAAVVAVVAAAVIVALMVLFMKPKKGLTGPDGKSQ